MAAFPVTFEFDPEKSAANKAKHGIDFAAAQALWGDPNGIAFPAKSVSEPRFGRLALLDGKLWMAYWTQRGEVVRLISVRRARPSERTFYESQD